MQKGVDKVDSGRKLAENKAQADRRIPEDRASALRNRASAPKDGVTALEDGAPILRNGLAAKKGVMASKNAISILKDKPVPENNRLDNRGLDCSFLSNVFTRASFFVFCL